MCAERKFIDFALATSARETPSEITVATIKTKAATITRGKNPSTSSLKNPPIESSPTYESEGRRNMITTNHFITCPMKYPLFNEIPAFLNKSSAPTD